MLTLDISNKDLKALRGMQRAVTNTMRKSGSTSVRDMKSEAKKRVRARKRLGAGKNDALAKSLHVVKPKVTAASAMDAQWGIKMKHAKIPLIHYRPRKLNKGISVSVNRGKRTKIRDAFFATMPKSGHRGVFVRKGKGRLKIRELLGSRPVDALLHEGEAEGVQMRGAESFAATFDRLLPMELEKLK